MTETPPSPAGRGRRSVSRTNRRSRACAALFGAFCVVVGGVALYIGLFTTKTLPWPFTPFWMSLLLTIGCIALLFHAAYDAHVEFRRVYQFLGVLSLIVGAVLCFLPYSSGGHGRAGDLLGPGVVLLSLGLLFLLFTLRNETDAAARNWLQLLLLAAGSVLTVIGLFGGNLSRDFLTPVGLVLALIGLIYLLAFVGSRGTSDDLAYRTGLVIGAVGAIVFFVALWRSTARFPIVEIVLILAVLVEVGPRLAVAQGYVGPEAAAPGSRFCAASTSPGWWCSSCSSWCSGWPSARVGSTRRTSRPGRNTSCRRACC